MKVALSSGGNTNLDISSDSKLSDLQQAHNIVLLSEIPGKLPAFSTIWATVRAWLGNG